MDGFLLLLLEAGVAARAARIHRLVDVAARKASRRGGWRAGPPV